MPGSATINYPLQRRAAAKCLSLACMALCLVIWPFGARTSLAAATASQKHIIIAGSGTNLSITRLLANAFMHLHPDITIEIPESIGSKAAIHAVSDGAIPIGLISRPLEGNEKSLELTVVEYARTALVLGVHPTVPDDNISYKDLLDIYRGKKNRWKDGREIIVLTREPGESSIDLLAREIPGFAKAYNASQKAELWSTLRKDQVMNQTLAKTPYAIGISDLGTMTIEHLNIKPLRINGTVPSPKNIKNGTYKLVKTLSLIYKKNNLPAPAKLFIDFVQSPNATKLLMANGFASGK